MRNKLKSPYFIFYFLLPLLIIMPFKKALSQDLKLEENLDVQAAIAVFDTWVIQFIVDHEIPGLSIGLVYDQELIWSKQYGYADLAKKIPTTPSTAYRIASLTKLFTATAIMQLRDAGKLQLDDPVTKYVPWFHLNDPYQDSPVITIRHLLTHTSGLPRELNGLYWDDVKFPNHDKFVQMFQEASTILPRETEYKYSNVAFSVLGEVIAIVSGESYPDYIEGHILHPLGMDATQVVPKKNMPGLATGYKYHKACTPREPEPFLVINAMTSAAGIATTVNDMARFVSLQFRSGPTGGNQILKGSTLKEMQRIQWLDSTWESGVGISWFINKYPERVQIRHGGYVNGFTSAISVSVAEKFGVIVFSNADDYEVWSVSNKAWSIVTPIIDEATAVSEKLKVADSTWNEFAGDYKWDDGSWYKVMIIKGELSVIDPLADNPWSERIRLELISPGVFRMETGSQKGELIKFDIDPRSKKMRMVWPGCSAIRE